MNTTNNKKLSLNKKTISNLNNTEMSEVYGGTRTTHHTTCTYPSGDADCQTHIVYCETQLSFCYIICL